MANRRAVSYRILEKVFDTLPYKLARSLVEKSYSNTSVEFTNIGILDKTQLAFAEIEIVMMHWISRLVPRRGLKMMNGFISPEVEELLREK